jgi:hypothetical protein
MGNGVLRRGVDVKMGSGELRRCLIVELDDEMEIQWKEM